jgi:uncharacterized protein YndB with AHSA1/START domain
MFRKLVIGLVAIILVLLAYAATRPDEFKVVRSATFNAPAADVFAVVNDFSRWTEWSPWADLDPNMKVTLEGPKAGEGAIYKWNGNDSAGEGENKLVESKPNELIRMKLTFLRPFPGEADVTFSFTSDGNATNTTWTMTSMNQFVNKLISVFIDCEEMCGKDFVKGLERLRTVVEKTPK